MKKHTNRTFAILNLENMVILTNIVKETLAYGIEPPVSKTFTAADLWNIRRQGKRRVQRRAFA